jgi:hypothetical protein
MKANEPAYKRNTGSVAKLAESLKSGYMTRTTSIPLYGTCGFKGTFHTINRTLILTRSSAKNESSTFL